MTKMAFVFPGQGSQSVGMLQDLAEQYPQIRKTFDQASAALDYDLWEVTQSDPEQRLNQTEVTQPALLTASVAVFQLLMDSGMDKPDLLAGHSLGEYSALVCAGVLSLSDAVKLVEARGQFMQQAVPQGSGAMYAIIGLADTEVVKACEQAASEAGDVVSAVNFNSPGQVVIAGSKAAVELGAEKCKQAGAKRALPLSVSVPSHCALMKPAAEQLKTIIQAVEFSTPSIPVVNNVDVATENSAENIKEALIRQLYCPVRWTETIEFIAAKGIEEIYEVGPGKVLSGLIKRIDKDMLTDSINTVESVRLLLQKG